MPHRSPARWLAPLALVLAALTIFLVTRSELGGSSEGSGTTSATTRSAGDDGGSRTSGDGEGSRTTSTARERTGATGRSGPRTYTVKPGDVLGSIAETTGVTVAELQEYNDIDDAQNLSVGQKLKLTP